MFDALLANPWIAMILERTCRTAIVLIGMGCILNMITRLEIAHKGRSADAIVDGLRICPPGISSILYMVGLFIVFFAHSLQSSTPQAQQLGQLLATIPIIMGAVGIVLTLRARSRLFSVE